MGVFYEEWEWEWQLSSNSSASMLAAAPGVYKLSAGENMTNFNLEGGGYKRGKEKSREWHQNGVKDFFIMSFWVINSEFM